MNHEDGYKEMYLALTNEITNTIERLQSIQRKAEECYICADEPTTWTLPKDAQIRPIEDLKDHYEEISAYCNKTGKPIYLTKNGELSLVIISEKTYNKGKVPLIDKKNF